MEINTRPEAHTPRQPYTTMGHLPRQVFPIRTGIVVLGHSDPVPGGPSSRMRARIREALAVYARSDSPLAIGSGGVGGAETEGRCIGRILNESGIAPIPCESCSKETVGNLVFTTLGIILELDIRNVRFVTDPPHALRIEALAPHILRGIVNFDVSTCGWPLSDEEQAIEFAKERAGMAFIRQLRSEVPAGDPMAALRWVATNHSRKPYSGIDLGLAVEAIRQGVRADLRIEVAA